MSDEGGETACWAHLLDEIDTRDAPPVVDITAVDGSGGAVWSLPHGGDLDANVVRLGPGDEIGRHTNGEVDVFVVVWDGDGTLVVEGRSLTLRSGIAALVPRGTSRTIRAGADGVTYLTIHRRRDPLGLRSR